MSVISIYLLHLGGQPPARLEADNLAPTSEIMAVAPASSLQVPLKAQTDLGSFSFLFSIGSSKE